MAGVLRFKLRITESKSVVIINFTIPQQWRAEKDLNLWPLVPKTSALPSELYQDMEPLVGFEPYDLLLTRELF